MPNPKLTKFFLVAVTKENEDGKIEALGSYVQSNYLTNKITPFKDGWCFTQGDSPHPLVGYSNFRYNNQDIKFEAHANKLTVSQYLNKEDDRDIIVAPFKKIIAAIDKKTPVAAIGINAHVGLEVNDSDIFIKQRFLEKITPLKDNDHLTGGAIDLVYNYPNDNDVKITINLMQSLEKKNEILCSVNFHHDIKIEANIMEIVDSFSVKIEYGSNLAKSILSAEG